MIPLNYHHLYYFYRVARAGSIAGACRRLLLAQPTVSAQIAQLERALGRKLFVRRKRRLHLTEDGQLVLDYAESIFKMGEELQDTLRDRPAAGLSAIQIGVLSGTPHAYGHALLEFVLKEFPGAHVDAREGSVGELLEELRAQKLDALLTDVSVRIPEHDVLDNHLLGRVPIVLAASPALARRYRALPRGLRGAPFILPSLPRQVYHQMLDLFTRWKVSANVVAEVQDVELACRLAASGHGIAPVNALTAAAKAAGSPLTALGGGRLPGLYESVYLVTRRRKWPNPILERILSKFRLNP